MGFFHFPAEFHFCFSTEMCELLSFEWSFGSFDKSLFFFSSSHTPIAIAVISTAKPKDHISLLRQSFPQDSLRMKYPTELKSHSEFKTGKTK